MSALERYASKQVKTPKVWVRPTIGDFRQDHNVLSFDQTLNATGWVHLGFEFGELKVYARGTIRTDVKTKGPLGNILKAQDLWDRLLSMDRTLVGGLWPDEILMELPAVGGFRTESSMMAAREVHRYTVQWFTTRVSFISIQRTRTMLAGPKARNVKKLGHQALGEWIPESATRTWNEHQRDAAINALGRLVELQKEKR
jgi:hypothetical protein